MKGIYLIANKGTLIVESKKTLIIKEKQVPEDYLNKEIYLCQDDLALGIIKLNNEKLVLLDEFDKLRDQHQISDDERKTLFADANSFFSYTITIVDKFSPAKKFEGETQDFIQEVKLKKEITTIDDIDYLEVLYDAEKLNLEGFKAEGVDYDIKHPKIKYKQLIADHRYLHIGFNRLKQSLKWGQWEENDIVKYHAAVVDSLRSIFFPMISKYEINS